MRSPLWKALANTCSLGGTGLDQALGVFDVLVCEEIQYAHDDGRRGQARQVLGSGR